MLLTVIPMRSDGRKDVRTLNDGVLGRGATFAPVGRLALPVGGHCETCNNEPLPEKVFVVITFDVSISWRRRTDAPVSGLTLPVGYVSRLPQVSWLVEMR